MNHEVEFNSLFGNVKKKYWNETLGRISHCKKRDTWQLKVSAFIYMLMICSSPSLYGSKLFEVQTGTMGLAAISD
jgi:hypothetical protein